MDNKLKDQLKKDFPAFFPSISNCDFSCQDGWYDIIRYAAEQYLALSEKYHITIYAAQVKEKFGRLVVYVNNGPGSAWDTCWEEAQAIYGEVERRSTESCEFCGDTNKEGAECETKESRGGYWVRTLCLSCRVVDEVHQKDFEQARAKVEHFQRELEEKDEKSD